MRAIRRWLRTAAAPLRGRTRVPRRPVIYNANNTDVRSHRRSALLVYMPEAFGLLETDRAFLRHQNLRRCRQMAAVLGEFGYRVDVVSKRDTAFPPARRYDLVISECIDWKRAAGWFRSIDRRVFLATTMPPGLHNEYVRRRHQCLAERRRCRVPRHRGYVEWMPAVRASHALVGVGNSHTIGTWAPMFEGAIYPFNTQGREVPEVAGDPKDFGAARRHFLFLASRPQLHKGLDLLLEVFPRSPDLHLYVCSDFKDEPDFCACYRQELFETPNIHPVGRVDVASQEFQALARTCAYVIHPSCSEGQAGAVAQGMHAGLIPLVTRESGIDTEDLGVTFADDALEEIERVIRDVAGRPPDWHCEHGARSRETARARYSAAAFEARWREIVTALVGPCG